MLGIILVIFGIIGAIIQANAWFVIPNVVVAGLFIFGGVIVAVQIIIAIVAAKKAKKTFKDLLK